MLALGKARRKMQAGKVGGRHILLPAAAISLLLFLTTPARGEEIYLPQDLDDAHRELLRLFGPAAIAQIKALKSEEDVYTIDWGIGLINCWELNANSPLALFFRRRGVADSHDMAGIVLATLWDRPLGLGAPSREVLPPLPKALSDVIFRLVRAPK